MIEVGLDTGVIVGEPEEAKLAGPCMKSGLSIKRMVGSPILSSIAYIKSNCIFVIITNYEISRTIN